MLILAFLFNLFLLLPLLDSRGALGSSWLGTFHSVSAKILRKHAGAIGLNSNFSIIDQDDQKRLVKNICKSENIDIKKEEEEEKNGVKSGENKTNTFFHGVKS